jgi:RNA polymerase-interacting CarD/CdnL/TRCF family regulator
MKFKLNQYVVYSGHGIGIVKSTVKKTDNEFYVVEIVNSGMTILVPTDKSDCLRPLVSKKELLQSNWNRNYRDMLDKIRNGKLLEILELETLEVESLLKLA